ncbi:MAG TPA: hypothetical protein VMW93_01690 [bacterium]|nr:hypothetical protein [bacterium]
MVKKTKAKTPKRKTPAKAKRPARAVKRAPAAAAEKDVAVNDKTQYDKLSARQKRTAAKIYRLWLRRYTIEQIVEMLEEKDVASISYITVRRYLKTIREHTRSRYEKQTLDDILDEETERFNEIIATLWNDHAQSSAGSPARVGCMNAIIAAETRLAEMLGLVVNRLKVDADVNARATGFFDVDLGEDTMREIDGFIEKILIARQAGARDGAP